MIGETLWMFRRWRRSIFAGIAAWPGNIAAWWRFWRSYGQYKRMAPREKRPSLDYLFPCIGDDVAETPIDTVYFYQDAWAFGKIIENRPSLHIDVGSHHKFVGLLSKVVPVTMIDVRPLGVQLDTLNFQKGSILDLPFANESVMSLSSLCVVEHIGLGRYGDPLDPDGTEKAIGELKRVVAPGGNLYVSLPLYRYTQTYFNAHRAFREEDVLPLFEPFRVVEKRYIYGNRFGDQIEPGFGTGCYHLRRPA